MAQTHETREIRQGDAVAVEYRGLLEDGAVFGANREGEPLRFVVGKGEVIKGMERAVVGMKTGESKTATVPPDDAFGSYHEELLQVIGRDRLPRGSTPRVGQWVELPEGTPGYRQARLVSVEDEAVTVDRNHPLAGRTLTIELHVVEVNPVSG